jgi:hypothetical protein
VKAFRTPTFSDAIDGAKKVGEIARYNMPASIRHHFDRLQRFPSRLIPCLPVQPGLRAGYERGRPGSGPPLWCSFPILIPINQRLHWRTWTHRLRVRTMAHLAHKGVLVGYARTSTADREAGLHAQVRDLQGAGCTKIFQERVSSIAQRAELERALDYVRGRDTLVVTKVTCSWPPSAGCYSLRGRAPPLWETGSRKDLALLGALRGKSKKRLIRPTIFNQFRT